MKTFIHVILMASFYLLSSNALATNHNYSWNHSKSKTINQKYINDLKSQRNYNFQWSNKSPSGSSSRFSSYSYSSSGSSSASASAYSSSSGGGYARSWTSTNAHSVPELDSNAAPLAGLLLTGLLAAGYERRRRKQLKTIKD